MKIGGVSGWIRAAALGEAHSIRLSNHLWPEIRAQLLCATTTAHWLEYADWWNPIMKEPLRIEKGRACLEDVTGSGIEWNEDAIRQHTA
jgi:mandelate racemase